MKIAVVGTVGLPANYGGFETLVENLVKYLDERYQFIVYCSSKGKVKTSKKYRKADLVYIPLKANGAQSALYDIVSILKATQASDMILVLGVSGCIALPIVKQLTTKAIVVHIDGIEWQRKKWGRLARLFLKQSERYAVNNADVIIADNLEIQQYVSREYQRQSELIEYGGDHVVPVLADIGTDWDLAFSPKSYAIKVCRIEPENNIGAVLDAFSKTRRMPLVLIGNWSNSRYGRKLRKEYEQYNTISLLDPIYDQRKLDSLRSNAAIYVHGHSAGGTNPSVVEAMTLGLPILAFDVPYNRETTKNRAVYFKTELDLIEILNNLDALDLIVLGQEMKELAAKYYKWDVITEKYAKVFQANSIQPT